MTQEELQTLLDIQRSGSFQELQSRTASRLGAVQQSFADKGYYNGKVLSSLDDLQKKVTK